MNVLNLLKGYKTYLIAAVTVVFGVVDKHNQSAVLMAYVLTGAGLAALRAAVAKVEEAITKIETKLPPSISAVVTPVVAAVESEVDAAVDAASGVASTNSK